MLEMTSKWFTNTLAKKSMQNNDFVACNDGRRLYVVGYGVLTNSGKNTYNVVLKDSEDKVLEEHSNLYLDAITKIILGASPKSKEGKETNESAKKNTKVSNNLCEEYKRLEANLKKAIIAFNDFKVAHNITTLQDASEAQNKAKQARRKAKQDARREEVAILKRIATLRKWAKETKRLELLQALNDKMLSI